MTVMTDEQRKQLKIQLVAGRALLAAMQRSPSANSPTDVWKFSSYKTFMGQYNQLVGFTALRINRTLSRLEAG